MHELGIMYHVVKQVENIAKQNELTEIQTLVLQIGEASSVVPHFIKACYPAAVDGSMLEDTELEIEVLPANAMCKECGKVFHILSNHKKCPHCQSTQWDMLTGEEFNIKEIIAC